MGKLIPILLAVIGLLAGGGAGYLLRPPAEPLTEGAEPPQDGAADADHGAPVTEGEVLHDYVKLNNQFVVPVVENGRVSAMVILSLSLEVDVGGTEQVYAREPKLRDALLQVMFDHANTGGFRGTFTDGANMVVLRNALREMARKVMGPMVTDVLIVDIVRQDN